MLGHYDIPGYTEFVGAAGPLQRMLQRISITRRTELWLPPVAAEGNEVHLAVLLEPAQSLGQAGPRLRDDT